MYSKEKIYTKRYYLIINLMIFWTKSIKSRDIWNNSSTKTTVSMHGFWIEPKSSKGKKK